MHALLEPTGGDLFPAALVSPQIDFWIPEWTEKLLFYRTTLDKIPAATGASGQESDSNGFLYHLRMHLTHTAARMRALELSMSDMDGFMRTHALTIRCGLVDAVYQGTLPKSAKDSVNEGSSNENAMVVVGAGGASGGPSLTSQVRRSTAFALLCSAAKLPVDAGPDDVDTGRNLVTVALDLSLPLVAPTLTSTHSSSQASISSQASDESKGDDLARAMSEETVVAVLMRDQSQGELLWKRYQNLLVRAVIGAGSTPCPLCGRQCRGRLLHASSAFVRCVQQAPADGVLRLMLLAVLSDVSADQSNSPRNYHDEHVSVLVNSAWPLFVPDSAPVKISVNSNDAMILVLEIDSRLPVMHRNSGLHRWASHHAITTLKTAGVTPSSSSSSSSSASSSSSSSSSLWNGTGTGKDDDHKTAVCEVLVQALRMVPYLLAGWVMEAPRSAFYEPDDATVIENMVEALEYFVAAKFPLNSMDQDPKSLDAQHYRRLLRAYLDMLLQCGALCLLRPLRPTILEGTHHRHHSWISSALSTIAVSMGTSYPLDVGVAALRAVCAYTFQVLADAGEDFEVKEMLFDHLCVPALMAADVTTLHNLFIEAIDTSELPTALTVPAHKTSRIKWLFDQTKKDVSVLGKDGISTMMMVQASCYRLIDLLYDRLLVQTLKTSITAAFVGVTPEGGNGVKGSELTTAISKTAHELVHKSPLPDRLQSFLQNNTSDKTIQSIKNRLFSSAYNCLATVICKTQEKENFYNAMLFVENDGEALWSRIVDCSTIYRFRRDTLLRGGKNRFETIYVGAAGVGALMNVPRDAGRLRQRTQSTKVKGTGGSYISQYVGGSFLDNSR